MSIANQSRISTPTVYAAGIPLTWVVGTIFMCGWHFATIGGGNLGVSAVDGLYFLAAALVATFIFRALGKRVTGMSFWVAMGLTLVLIGGAFPVGAVMGSFWDGLWGNYPDMSTHMNRSSAMIFIHRI